MHFHFLVIIGMTMGNEPKNRISLTNHFLMALVQFLDNFTIVMWQTNQLKIGLRMRFWLQEVPFLVYTKIFSNACTTGNSEIFGYARKGTSSTPDKILIPLYN